MIIAQQLCKKFGSQVALDKVSFEIRQGQWVALLGANGAGKTTLNRILALLTRPSAGKAQVAGLWLHEQPDRVRQRIGVVGHHPLLYGDLSALENLTFYASMYGLAQPQDRIRFLLHQTGLDNRREDLVRTFSRGMQQRLALARAMLHQPSVLLLDEPFTGLDVHAGKLLTEFMVQAVQQQVTVLMTTHDVDYALAHTHKVLVLVKGRLLLDRDSHQVQAAQIAGLLQEQDA